MAKGDSPAPAEIVEQRMGLGRKFCVCVIRDGTPSIWSTTKTLRKKIESNAT